MHRKKLLPIIASSLLVAGANFAQADDLSISGNVSLISDYKFRGISQSNKDGALQGGFDAEFGPGFYVGTWGSTVNFDTNGEDGGCCNGSMELDYYGGWGTDIGDTGFSVDMGYIYYSYPGDNDNDADYQEVYVSGSWQALTVGVHYSDDYYLESDEFWYVYGDYSFNLPWDLSLSLHAGYNVIEEDGGFLSSDEDGYTDYSVSLSKTMWGVDWAIAYTGTDLDDDDLFGNNWGDNEVIYSMSKSF